MLLYVERCIALITALSLAVKRLTAEVRVDTWQSESNALLSRAEHQIMFLIATTFIIYLLHWHDVLRLVANDGHYQIW